MEDYVSKTTTQTNFDLNQKDQETIKNVIARTQYLAMQMIHQANNRSDKEKGDPKVGGHMSASSSALHIMGALHLFVKTGFDHIANKPHASPTDHSYNYLLNLFLKSDFSKLSLEEANTAMLGLRKFSQNGEPVFQSYHSAFDCDNHNFFPSGTVGIPPVQAGYMALAYRYAKDHGYKVPDAHFWSLIGDSEFREGSLFEATPDFAEREIGNLTWIVDYNRQSLDGHRITNKKIMNGTDAQRIERTMSANGWEVIQLQHGLLREALFKKPDGQIFKNFLENELEDYELQALLLVQDMKALKKGLTKERPKLKKFLESIGDADLYNALHDFGGHDIVAIVRALEQSKLSSKRPTIIIAHTIKGWNLKMAAATGNHSALMNEEELAELKKKVGITGSDLFARFEEKSEEGKFLKKRSDELYQQILQQEKIKKENSDFFAKEFSAYGEFPHHLDINTKMASYPHTQWMLGQLTAKLTRIANTSLNESNLLHGQKALTNFEKSWKTASELLVSMAPDVGTSTNLNPAMDGKIFGAPVPDYEQELGVKDNKTPDIVPGEDPSDRFLRFEIVEGNVMSCMGSFGRLRDTLGIPVLPLMTVYDFFIKRALDQYFYNLYWKSSYILVGTPSGVTLSPEGAQHGWKSDFQIPNQITWEPFYCIELDWILSESMRLHMLNQNQGRSGVLIRNVTRGIEQKDFLNYLKKQARFKADYPGPLHPTGLVLDGSTDESTVTAKSDEEILNSVRTEVLAGAYHLINFEGYAGYELGDNVVNIFAMGSLTTEAIKASEELLKHGVYANVIVVTSPDLLCGILAHENDYSYLKQGIKVNSDLHIRPVDHLNGAELVTVAGRRVPIVSVHDGEAGLLDNLGSIIGVKQESLAVRKHSKCGRPKDIYEYHHMDYKSVIEACGKVLSETALEEIKLNRNVFEDSELRQKSKQKWSDLWPTRLQNQH